MGWRLQRRFSLNLSSLCVTDLTAVAIHNASTTAVAVLSGDACSGKPPFTGHFCRTGICECPCRFRVSVSVSGFGVGWGETGGVSGIPVVDVRYVGEDGVPVAATLDKADVHRMAYGVPVRKVRSNARRRHFGGAFWSATNSGHVPDESRLELDHLWLSDFAPEVVRIAA